MSKCPSFDRRELLVHRADPERHALRILDQFDGIVTVQRVDELLYIEIVAAHDLEPVVARLVQLSWLVEAA